METTFANPFQLADLLVFDEAHFCQILGGCIQKMTLEQVARGMRCAPAALIPRVQACLSPAQRALFSQAGRGCAPRDEIEQARQRLLDLLFWELTYWKTPELYEELTAGEQLHPGIFPQLEPLLRDRIVLDVGAGVGRASFECLRHGAALVYALEPSPGLLRLLRKKLDEARAEERIRAGPGDFAHLPLPDQSVDLALACSSFTADPEQGGEPGLAELRRVVRPEGAIVLIWPRPEDRRWLIEHGFEYVELPCEQELSVCFPSYAAALRCARRFYAHNQEVMHYLLRERQSVVPFSVIGSHPPCDYCLLRIK